MTGRWPANVILSPDMAEVLDGQSGFSKSSTNPNRFKGSRKFAGATYAEDETSLSMESIATAVYGDEGGASRFFLNAGYEQWELEWIYSVGLRPCGTEQQ